MQSTNSKQVYGGYLCAFDPVYLGWAFLLGGSMKVGIIMAASLI